VAVSQQSWHHGNHDLKPFQPVIAGVFPAHSLWLRRVVHSRNALLALRSFSCPGRGAGSTSSAVRSSVGTSEAPNGIWTPAQQRITPDDAKPVIGPRSARTRRRRRGVLRCVRGASEHSRGADRVRVLYAFVAQKTEGAGKAGCWSHPQPGVRKMKAHQPSRHRFNRVIPAFPARVVLTVSFVLSPVSMTS
jgi:hypothetical protein